jgi:hypothetical protein
MVAFFYFKGKLILLSMFEEGKSNSLSDIRLLAEAADCDRLEGYLGISAQQPTQNFIDYLFLALCEKFQTLSEYENCINYMLL